ncbi:MAG TPA: Ppx/GppA phosphatase family protein, partial [Tepidisphaeraceae bacterium]|nr:Ppx/GppA phosphatase family protein [Tepidisphaeraceae bacterium]
RMKEMVGLGRISFPSRRLTAEAIDRAVNTLERFKLAAMQRQCEKIVVVATSAVREATNGGDLIQRIREQLKLYVKVVSAREEARLIYLGVRHATPLGKQPNLIIDIGGGSVEFIVGNELSAAMLESRKLGAARMTARFVKSDPLDKTDRRALVRHYESELSTLIEQIKKLDPSTVIGTSGTIENIAQMCGETDSDGRPIVTKKGIEKIYDKLTHSSAAERETIGGLDDQRKEQIVAAVVLVKFLFDRLKFKRMQLCDAALREGILVDYLARHIPDLEVRREVPDPRRRVVIDLARRSNWHEQHSTQVALLTMQLWDELKSVHRLGAGERELVEYASLLHDIGWHIGPSGHHKHSEYLILHSDLSRFFSEEEVAIIANIARYHRKKPPTDDNPRFASLSKRAKEIVTIGAAMLRVADGLDRSHSSVVRSLKCRIVPDKVLVKLDVKADAELEIWGARRKCELFESTFKRAIEFVEK